MIKSTSKHCLYWDDMGTPVLIDSTEKNGVYWDDIGTPILIEKEIEEEKDSNVNVKDEKQDVVP